jgi:hypothetical protein
VQGLALVPTAPVRANRKLTVHSPIRAGGPGVLTVHGPLAPAGRGCSPCRARPSGRRPGANGAQPGAY